MPPRRKKQSPALNAGKKARRYLGKNRLTDQQQAEYLMPNDLRWSFQKQRKEITEPLNTFGEDDIEKHIDPRGMNANVNTQDPAYAIAPEEGEAAYLPAGYQSGDPELYEVPTKTSTPDRPRTVAAAYDPDRSVLTVMFRDSTLYNYYDVDLEEWFAFRDLDSKWQFIRDYLDFKPRGPASVGDLPIEMRQEAYVLARASQISKSTKPKK